MTSDWWNWWTQSYVAVGDFPVDPTQQQLAPPCAKASTHAESRPLPSTKDGSADRVGECEPRGDYAGKIGVIDDCCSRCSS